MTVDNIWSIIATNYPELKQNDVSKDIALGTLETSDLTINVTVHHTDTVSLMAACSLTPIEVGVKGLIRLSNALTRVEERLIRFLNRGPLSLSSPTTPIPDHNSWIVTMWHFGKDSLNEYTGKEFETTWDDGENALLRVYTKDMKDGKGIRIRKESQEYPNTTFEQAIEDKMNIVSHAN